MESTPLVFQISQNGTSQGIRNLGYHSTEAVSNTDASRGNPLPSISEVSSCALSANGVPTTPTSESSAASQSKSTTSGTSKLPPYSELEIVLSPKSMNDHYMSLQTQQKSQIMGEPADNGGMEYQVGNDIVLVSRVVDTKKLNVVNDKLSSAVARQESITKCVSDPCTSSTVEPIQDKQIDNTCNARESENIVKQESKDGTVPDISTGADCSNKSDDLKNNTTLEIEKPRTVDKCEKLTKDGEKHNDLDIVHEDTLKKSHRKLEESELALDTLSINNTNTEPSLFALNSDVEEKATSSSLNDVIVEKEDFVIKRINSVEKCEVDHTSLAMDSSDIQDVAVTITNTTSSETEAKKNDSRGTLMDRRKCSFNKQQM